MKSTPVRATWCTLASVMPPEASSFALPPDQCHRLFHFRDAHVIQHDDVRPGFQGFLRFAGTGDFNLDGYPRRGILPGFGDNIFQVQARGAQRGDMVVFD